METTKNKLDPSVRNFLKNLSEYLNTKLYFYGSVQRNDYILNKSDIDINIFTDNIESTVLKLSHYLNVPKSKFKKTFLIIYKDDIYKYKTAGYKIYYTSPNLISPIEFAIYNEKDKEQLIEITKEKFNVPLLISFLLMVIKFFFYTVQIIPLSTYRPTKNWLLDQCSETKNMHVTIF